MHRRNSGRVKRAARRLVLAGAGILSLSLFAAPACLAESMQLALSKEAVQEQTTQVTFTASSVAVGYYALAVNPAGTPCASQPEADAGTALNDMASEPHGETGNYSGSVNFTPQNTGPYMLCGWIIGNGPGESPVYGPTLATASLAIEARPPHITLSVGVPSRIHSGQKFRLRLTATSEVNREMIVVGVPDTHGCPVSPAATTAANLIDTNLEGGPTVITAAMKPLYGHGRWIFCAYASPPKDKGEDPEATASAVLTVGAPSAHHHKKKKKKKKKRHTKKHKRA
jgi:hypothetical protein